MKPCAILHRVLCCRLLCDNVTESYIKEITQYLFEEIKWEQKMQDVKFWIENGRYRECKEFLPEEKYNLVSSIILFRMLCNPYKSGKEIKVSCEKIENLYKVFQEKGYIDAAFRMIQCLNICEKQNNRK